MRTKLINEVKKFEVQNGDIVLIKLAKDTQDLPHKIAQIGRLWEDVQDIIQMRVSALVYPYGMDIDIMTSAQKKTLIKMLRESLKTCDK